MNKRACESGDDAKVKVRAVPGALFTPPLSKHSTDQQVSVQVSTAAGAFAPPPPASVLPRGGLNLGQHGPAQLSVPPAVSSA